MRPPFLFVALSAALLSGCYSAGDGQAPPLQSLYFPTGLALDVIPNPDGVSEPVAPPKHLYIASSDFDLQYNASALAAYDLEVLAQLLPQSCNRDDDCSAGRTCDTRSPDPSFFCVAPDGDPCESRGVHSPADQLLYPGRCQSIEPRSAGVIADSVEIGAFATDIVFKTTGPDGDPNYPGRLFLPVRGDATLHWIDVDGEARANLHCGQDRSGSNRCDAVHRVGDDPNTESDNQLRQQPEPFGIAIDDAGNNIAVTNQTTGSVSLYANQWESGLPPRLVDVLGYLPTAPVAIAALPTPKPFDPNYQSGFLAVYRNAAQVDLLRVRTGATLDPNPVPAPDGYNAQILTRAGSASINANSLGFDSRGIVIDDSQRKADYRVCDQPCIGLPPLSDAFAACEAQIDPTCFRTAHQPKVFVSNRAPSSLLVGALTPDFSYTSGTSELPAFSDTIPLTAGPSRVVLGRVKVPSTAAGSLSDAQGSYAFEPRVFVVCFDSRRIYVYDPARRVIDSIVATGRGPFALAIDEQRGYGYIAHFTDSYLGVISLDQRFPKNYAAIIASVGVPSPPRASK